jgi:hypothetical protein
MFTVIELRHKVPTRRRPLELFDAIPVLKEMAERKSFARLV